MGEFPEDFVPQKEPAKLFQYMDNKLYDQMNVRNTVIDKSKLFSEILANAKYLENLMRSREINYVFLSHEERAILSEKIDKGEATKEEIKLFNNYKTSKLLSSYISTLEGRAGLLLICIKQAEIFDHEIIANMEKTLERIEDIHILRRERKHAINIRKERVYYYKLNSKILLEILEKFVKEEIISKVRKAIKEKTTKVA